MSCVVVGDRVAVFRCCGGAVGFRGMPCVRWKRSLSLSLCVVEGAEGFRGVPGVTACLQPSPWLGGINRACYWPFHEWRVLYLR